MLEYIPNQVLQWHGLALAFYHVEWNELWESKADTWKHPVHIEENHRQCLLPEQPDLGHQQ